MRRIALVTVGIALAATPASAHAAAWGVDNTTDTPIGQPCPSFTGCSLREAVTSTELRAGPDAILVSGGTYPLTNGQLTITQDLQVARVGAFSANIQGVSSRIFDITGSGSAFVLRFLTVSNGSAADEGGAIRAGTGTTVAIESSTIQNSTATGGAIARGGAISSQGPVTVGPASGSTTPSTISGNTATTSDPSGAAKGGGLAVDGTLTVGARSVISGNHATATGAGSTALGGGVFAPSGLTLNAATVSGNTATADRAVGGGIGVETGTTALTRTTVSGNSATGTGNTGNSGGGAFGADPDAGGNAVLQATLSTIANNTAALTAGAGAGARALGGAIQNDTNSTTNAITNSTVAGNTATAPVADRAEAGTIQGGGAGTSQYSLDGSIVAENTQSSGQPCQGATLNSGGDNVLGPTSACTYNAGSGDATNVSDAGLTPLANHGGVTETIGLERSSTALNRIDAASALCTNFPSDQRGVARPQLGACDSGAFEARPATITVSPSTRDFGSVGVGNGARATVAVVNTGGDLPLTGVNATTAAPFSLVDTNPICAGPIQVDESCTATVRFRPTDTGLVSQSLDVTADDGVTGSNTLTGTGVPPPAVSFSPSPVAFGDQRVGTSSTQTVTITNTGTAPLTIRGWNLPSDPRQFSLTNDNCKGQTIAADDTCTFDLTFNARVVGPTSTTLSVGTNAPGSPQQLAISGTGTHAGLSFSPPSVAFGNQSLGTSSTQTVTITNTGTASLTIRGWNLPSSPRQFSLINDNCKGQTIAAGDTCTFDLRFRARVLGPTSTTLTVADNAPGSPQQLPVSGTVT